MPRPICVSCACEMKCERNDQCVNDPKMDKFPSTYWLGDKYKCPACESEVVVDFGEGSWNRPESDSIEFSQMTGT